MKKCEVIEMFREKIAELMREDYRAVLNAKGQTQYKIYVWEDGEVEDLYDVQGSNSWLQAKDWEERKLYYVTTIEYPCFDPWDCASDPMPDDEEEREKAEAEIVNWLCGEYDNDVEEIIDRVIEEAKLEEANDNL